MRRPLGTPRAAVVLWIVFAIVVWNVVFDRILVVAGRQYVHAATLAARSAKPYLLINDWMRPARARAIRTATVSGLLTLAAGLVAVAVAVSREGKASSLKPQVSSLNCKFRNQSEI